MKISADYVEPELVTLVSEEDDEDASDKQSNIDYDDINAIEELSESEGDDDVDNNMDAVQTNDNDPADDWCYGGYDEDTGDLIQCGRLNCKNCS